MATSEHCTIADVRFFLTCCKCRTFLLEYKEKYILLCVYTCIYMHTYIQVPQTQVNTDTLRDTNEKKLFFVFAPSWATQWAARSSWLCCCSWVIEWRCCPLLPAEQEPPLSPAELTSRNSWFLHTSHAASFGSCVLTTCFGAWQGLLLCELSCSGIGSTVNITNQNSCNCLQWAFKERAFLLERGQIIKKSCFLGHVECAWPVFGCCQGAEQ